MPKDEIFPYGKYEDTLLRDLKSTVFGNGKPGIKTLVYVLIANNAALTAGMVYLIKNSILGG